MTRNRVTMLSSKVFLEDPKMTYKETREENAKVLSSGFGILHSLWRRPSNAMDRFDAFMLKGRIDRVAKFN